jgi:hypothetical protein
MNAKPVLLAVPQNWAELGQIIEQAGFSVLSAHSLPAALDIVQSQALYAVVLISDWAITQEDGSAGLMMYLKGKVPTYALITVSTYKNYEGTWLFEIYERPQHEYEHAMAGVAAESVINFLLRCGSFK